MPKEKSAPNKMASSSDDCDRHRRKRISKPKSSRGRDVYVSPYQQILHLMNTFQIRQCEERRCRSPKNMYVKRRKIKSWKKMKVKTLTVTVSLKTTKLANDVRVVNRGSEIKEEVQNPRLFQASRLVENSISSQIQ